jgi:hypothetical protein
MAGATILPGRARILLGLVDGEETHENRRESADQGRYDDGQ